MQRTTARKTRRQKVRNQPKYFLPKTGSLKVHFMNATNSDFEEFLDEIWSFRIPHLRGIDSVVSFHAATREESPLVVVTEEINQQTVVPSWFASPLGLLFGLPPQYIGTGTSWPAHVSYSGESLKLEELHRVSFLVFCSVILLTAHSR